MNLDLDSINKQTQSLANQLREMRATLERLRRTRDDLLASPVAKSDLKDAARKQLAEQQIAFAAVVRAQLDVFIRNPDRLAKNDVVARHMTLMGATRKPGELVATPHSMDVVLAGLMGPAITEAYLKAIDALEFEEGPTIADRDKRADALSIEIDTLQVRFDELSASARRAFAAIDGV